jgi:hypothetical protein
MGVETQYFASQEHELHEEKRTRITRREKEHELHEEKKNTNYTKKKEHELHEEKRTRITRIRRIKTN